MAKVIGLIRIVMLSALGQGVLSALMLVSSFFAPFCLFPPLMTYIKQGRLKGLSVFAFALATCLLLGGVVTATVYFLFVVLVGVVIAEFLISGNSGFKTLVYTSTIVLGIYLIALLGVAFIEKINPQDLILNKTQTLITVMQQALGEQGLQDFLKSSGLNKQELVSTIAEKIPSMLVISVILFILFNLILLSNFVLTLKAELTFSKLMSFKLPDAMIWPTLIIGLFYAYTTSDYNTSVKLSVLAGVLLKAVLVFYFIQGLAIVYLFLAFSVKTPFFRSMLFSLAVIFAYLFITVVGFFDTWFDFRKMLKKKQDDGGEI